MYKRQKLLKALGYQENLLIEVPAPTGNDSDKFRGALRFLASAHDEYRRGEWRTSVERCRQALESLGADLSETSAPNGGDWKALFNDRDSLTKEQRLRAVRHTMFALTSLAVHAKGEVAENTQWHSEDALAVLTMTAGTVRWLSEAATRGRRV